MNSKLCFALLLGISLLTGACSKKPAIAKKCEPIIKNFLQNETHAEVESCKITIMEISGLQFTGVAEARMKVPSDWATWMSTSYPDDGDPRINAEKSTNEEAKKLGLNYYSKDESDPAALDDLEKQFRVPYIFTVPKGYVFGIKISFSGVLTGDSVSLEADHLTHDNYDWRGERAEFVKIWGWGRAVTPNEAVYKSKEEYFEKLRAKLQEIQKALLAKQAPLIKEAQPLIAMLKSATKWKGTIQRDAGFMQSSRDVAAEIVWDDEGLFAQGKIDFSDGKDPKEITTWGGRIKKDGNGAIYIELQTEGGTRSYGNTFILTNKDNGLQGPTGSFRGVDNFDQEAFSKFSPAP